MPSIAELAELAWTGSLDLATHPPVARRAEFLNEEIADGVFLFVGMANSIAVDTGDGLVMLDTGTRGEGRHLRDAIQRWRPNSPVRSIVFSHHHIDHIGGYAPFDSEAATRGLPRPTVYAHAALPSHTERYARTTGWQVAINSRQAGHVMPLEVWPTGYRTPDITFDDRLTFECGDSRFALQHDFGETDDAVWTWLPGQRILHTGDLFIWAFPNAGNPQKVQRYAGRWADALEAMAALKPAVLLPGHGMPIFGAERACEALLTTAGALRSLDQQVVALMNRGASLDTVMRSVRLPERFDVPYLQPVYDRPEFVIRNIWRLYGGWWDGEIDTLLPAPRSDLAFEWVTLAGGTDRVASRAYELLDEGRPDLATHLIEAARHASPTNDSVHLARAAILGARTKLEASVMARGIFELAAESSRFGRRDLADSAD